MRYFFVPVLLLCLGAGCTSLPFFVAEQPAAYIEVQTGTALILEDKKLGLPLLPGKKGEMTTVIVEAWDRGGVTKLSWLRLAEQETEASKQAQQEALRRISQGEDIVLPEPVLETVEMRGEVQADGLDDAQRILLPAFWPEGDATSGTKASSLLWLSDVQYRELTESSETEIQLSAVDAGLQNVVDFAAVAQEYLQKITGTGTTQETVDAKDLTRAKVTGSGTYTLTYNEKAVQVPVLVAENSFATYTILVNPSNPLILEVNLKAWSFGSEILDTLQIRNDLSGYKITNIKY